MNKNDNTFLILRECKLVWNGTVLNAREMKEPVVEESTTDKSVYISSSLKGITFIMMRGDRMDGGP